MHVWHFSTRDTRTLVNWVRQFVTPWCPGGEHIGCARKGQSDANEDATTEGHDGGGGEEEEEDTVNEEDSERDRATLV